MGAPLRRTHRSRNSASDMAGKLRARVRDRSGASGAHRHRIACDIATLGLLDAIGLLAQAGKRQPRAVRQPANGFDDLGEGCAAFAAQQNDDRVVLAKLPIAVGSGSGRSGRPRFARAPKLRFEQRSSGICVMNFPQFPIYNLRRRAAMIKQWDFTGATTAIETRLTVLSAQCDS